MKRTTFDAKCPKSAEDSAAIQSHKFLLLFIFCILALMISPAAANVIRVRADSGRFE